MSISGILAASLVFAAGGDASQLHALRAEQAVKRDVQSRLEKVVSGNDLPGATAAMITGKGDAITFAAGFADKEIGREMTPRTRMMSGSIGKMFAAAVAVSLVQDGVIELDAPISKWLGADSEYARLPNYRDITVRMLLGHTSGLIDYVYDDSFWTIAKQRTKDADFAFSANELVAFGYGSKALFEPGKGFHYTDLGYVLLGLVIEKAAGEDYYSLLQQRFLYPLGLSLTGPSSGRIFNDLAQGYLAKTNPLLGEFATTLENGVFRINTRSEWTGGGLVTNAEDLAQWAWHLFEGRTRLGKEYSAAMVSAAVATGEGGKYGFGVYVFDTQFGPLYAHGGWFMGYRSYLGYFPSCHVAAAIQINSERVGDRVSALFKEVFAPALHANGCKADQSREADAK